MSEKKRSTLFKFCYAIVSIITAPIYVFLYLLRHPILVFIILGMLAGTVLYFPIKEGIEFADIPQWYKNHYAMMKMQVVNQVAESGNASFVPQALQEEVRQMQKEIQAEADEALRPKGENYNQKITRDEKFDETSVALKKRSGFKKKTVDVDTEVENKDIATEETSALLTENNTHEEVEVAVQENDSSVLVEEIAEEKTEKQSVAEESVLEPQTETDNSQGEAVSVDELVTEEVKSQDVVEDPVLEILEQQENLEQESALDNAQTENDSQNELMDLF